MGIPFWVWATTFVVFLAGVGFSISVLVFMRRASVPKFSGPALTGTGRVLAIPSLGLMSGGGAVVGNIQLFLHDMGQSGSRLCSIALRVEVPGREPYDATVWKVVDRTQVAAVESGAAFPVEVDSADPHKVRIDLNRPVPHSAPPAADNRATGGVTSSPATNTLAIASLVTAFLFPVIAIPMSLSARSQIRKTGERGAGIALASLLISCLYLVGIVVAVVVVPQLTKH
ncbi:DUF4190 domain-containing protein [Mycobacterium sp. UM_CSW]|uniref:DUF4190 domain-containing protein n=1 Tax=Mycobacterium sp. UM_CSW TaxID=1370119 RepID=UPI0009DC4580|nr:DUF4190 domain-containing protein [Mycobacterium sp. UM_CSW]